MTEAEARLFADHWIKSWNSHELDSIMSHYADSVVLVSPAAARLLGDPSGTVTGRESMREYFKRGLQAYPDLNFDLIDVMAGVSSVVLCYVNQRGSRTAEFMEFDANGKVLRVVANYSG